MNGKQKGIVDRLTVAFRDEIIKGLQSGGFFSISIGGNGGRVDSVYAVRREEGSEKLIFYDVQTGKPQHPGR